jgi:hypothetical protein
MVYFLQPADEFTPPPAPPRRQRVIIVGAGAAGLSAAFHIGEHSLLLERRQDLEECHDRSHDFPMGVARTQSLGAEDSDPDGEGAGVSTHERKALFITCSSQGDAGSRDHTLIHVTRWQPPALTPARPRTDSPTYRTLAPLLRGELRLGAWVVRINPSERLLELADGTRYVYDKLFCTQSLASVASLVLHEVPGRVRNDDALRYWLQDQDIEMGDRGTRQAYGDIDGFAAGRRVADQITYALSEKFRNLGHPMARSTPLFQPRLVSARTTPATDRFRY